MTSQARGQSRIERLESRVLFSTIQVSLNSMFDKLEFVDNDGTVVDVGQQNGDLVATVEGDNLVQIDTHKTLYLGGLIKITATAHHIAGSNIRLKQIDFHTSTFFDNPLKSWILRIVGHGGDESFDIGDVNLDGPLGRLEANNGNLTGTINGNSELNQVRLKSINGGTIRAAGSKVGANIAVGGDATDAVIDMPNMFAKGLLVGGTWTQTAPHASSITMLGMNLVQAGGALEADLHLTSPGKALRSVKAGSLDGDWSVAGRVQTISAVNSSASWNATVSGKVSSMKINAFSGTVSADSFGSIRAVDMANAHVTATHPFDGRSSISSVVAATMSGSSVRANGSIASVKLGTIDGSIIAAGVGLADTVSSSTDFAAPTFIKSFRSGTFSDSAILSAQLSKVALGILIDQPPTIPFFGVAATTIKRLTGNADPLPLRLSGLTAASDVNALLAAQGVTFTSFELRLF